jgi:hypothetical protein
MFDDHRGQGRIKKRSRVKKGSRKHIGFIASRNKYYTITGQELTSSQVSNYEVI